MIPSKKNRDIPLQEKATSNVKHYEKLLLYEELINEQFILFEAGTDNLFFFNFDPGLLPRPFTCIDCTYRCSTMKEITSHRDYHSEQFLNAKIQHLEKGMDKKIRSNEIMKCFRCYNYNCHFVSSCQKEIEEHLREKETPGTILIKLEEIFKRKKRFFTMEDVSQFLKSFVKIHCQYYCQWKYQPRQQCSKKPRTLAQLIHHYNLKHQPFSIRKK